AAHEKFLVFGLRKNIPSDLAEHLFYVQSTERRDVVVNVDIAKISIQDGESVAHAGQDGFAFANQIPHLELPAPGANSYFHCSDQSHRAQRSLQQRHVRGWAKNFQSLNTGAIASTGRGKDDHRQIRPWRLAAEFLQQP